MADHVYRDYSGQKVTLPKHYVKCEIESYDPSHIYYLYGTGWKGSNIIQDHKDAFSYWTGNNQNANFTINSTYKILSAGSYRVEVFLFTTTKAETISLKINGKSIGTPVSAKTVDTFRVKFDFGIQNIPKGNIPLQVTAGGHIGFITVYLRKVRITTGDSELNGILTIEEAKATIGTKKQADALTLTIKHEDKPYNQGGFNESGNVTGLIFEYADSINFYATDDYGILRQVFGGYITEPLVSTDKLSIEISCVGRLQDGSIRDVIKQITVGGAENDITTLNYTAKTLYDALTFLCQSIELPLKTGNLNTIKNEIPSKLGYHINYSNKTYRNKATKKHIFKTENIKSITLRNDYRKNKSQETILWDSSWNKSGEKKGYNITDTNVFFLKYGMGDKPVHKTVNIWIPKQYTKKTHKVKKGTGVKKKKTGTFGYDTDNPFMCWIEIQYSTSPGKSATRKTVNIEFTADHTDKKIGTITPVLKNNTIKIGELDVISILKVTDPATNYYWRRLALKWSSAGDNDLYDISTEESTYKMLFYEAGWHEGTAETPQVLQSSGQKNADQIYICQEDLDLNMYVKYAKDRKDDKLMFFREDSEVNLIELKEGTDGNVLSVDDIKYTPITKLKNSIIKVYKTSDTTNKYVTSKNISSIFRFREHTDIEVLDDNIGTYAAIYLARTDVDKFTKRKFTYTLPVEGYLHVNVGQYVITTLNNAILNDLQDIQSKEVTFNPEDSPTLKTSLGLGEMSAEVASDVNISQLRKTIKSKSILYANGASEDDYTDLLDGD